MWARQCTGARTVAARRRRISFGAERDQLVVAGIDCGSPFFGFLGAGDGEVGGGEHREGDMSVPGVVVPDLVMVQAGVVLAGLEGLLDRPAAPATRMSSATGVGVGPAQR